MSDTEPENWPAREGETVVVDRREETLAGGPPPVGPGLPPDRRIGAGMLLALAAIVLVGAGAALAWYLTHRDSSPNVTTVVVQSNGGGGGTTATKVAVPSVTNGTVKDAKTVLDAAGFEVATTGVASDRPAGTVIGQAPTAGSTLAQGGRITLSVARGSSPTTTGGTSTTTAATTTGATTTAPSTTAPTTTSSAPPTPANATVPDVSSTKEADAVAKLNAAGILASLFFVPGSDPLGTVEQQAKPAGTTVPYHSHMQINISSGPGTKAQEQVPDVVGRTLTDALHAINAAGLRLIYVKVPVTSRTQAGKVVQQSPLGGGHAPHTAQVAVFLGAFRG